MDQRVEFDIKEYFNKCEFMYLDSIENNKCKTYLGIIYRIRKKKLKHQLRVGKMIVYLEQRLN